MLALLIAATLAQDAGSATSLTIDYTNAQELDRLASHPALTSLHMCCLPELLELPASIGALTHLRELIIDNGNSDIMNPVLPEALGDLPALEKLVLYGAQDADQEAKNPKLRERHP